MRVTLSTLLLIALLFGFGFWYLMVGARCPVPLSYHIDTIDPRFNMSAEELRTLAERAESLWEGATGRNLLTYTPREGIPVRLIFDERQQTANEEAELRDVLEKQEGMSESVRTQYESLLSEYEKLKKAYDTRVAAYESDLAVYNAEVSEWNEKGGAPQQVFEKLERTQTELAKEADSLNVLTNTLNNLVRQMNALGARGNTIITDYNEVVEEYNDLYTEEGEFTQGDYRGTEINIYQFDSRDELTIVLAHEFGHALSLNHVGDERAVMYHLMEKQSLETGVTPADVAEFTQVCGVEEPWWVTVRSMVRTFFAMR